ncbi:MAG: prolyl oligopeptidase family serine peptidase [Gemmatimonadota bacterium]
MRLAVSLLIMLGAAERGAAQNYHRADQFLTWNLLRQVYHDQVTPTWYRDSTRFWYRVPTRAGFEFLSVSPATGVTAPLFDHARLAAARSVAADTAFDLGKLFLIHGDLDDNVHPGHTIALVDALIKAAKTFDLLIVPDADHNLTPNPYVIRRTWDYFVEHLLNQRPPADYLIAPPTP